MSGEKKIESKWDVKKKKFHTLIMFHKKIINFLTFFIVKVLDNYVKLDQLII